MIPLFDESQFDLATSLDLLPLRCKSCKGAFFVEKRQLQTARKGAPRKKFDYCSRSCIYSSNRINCKCSQCGSLFERKLSSLRSANVFCSQSCAASYNNTHKRSGVRVSKLEVYIRAHLEDSYPSIEFHFNRKDAINSELDIYIPTLSLAFELNGIFHYEPIFGKDKLSQIQSNDSRKFQACLERGIELCIIDVSALKYFKLDRADIYLGIVTKIIDAKLAVVE